jgi:hypothetical protein
MNPPLTPKRIRLLFSCGLTAVITCLPLSPHPGWSQVPWPGAPGPMTPIPTTPNSQRNALSNVRSRVSWLQNATRSAPSYANNGAQMLWQQFQSLRESYSTFTQTLNAQQAAYGGNELAELGAGLDIIQEAFNNYQDDLASGRYPATAMSDLCQVLQEASAAWLQELNQDCARLRVGW